MNNEHTDAAPDAAATSNTATDLMAGWAQPDVTSRAERPFIEGDLDGDPDEQDNASEPSSVDPVSIAPDYELAPEPAADEETTPEPESAASLLARVDAAEAASGATSAPQDDRAQDDPDENNTDENNTDENNTDENNTDENNTDENHAPRSDDTPNEPAAIEPSGFAALGLRKELLSALNTLGYEEPTPIQRETIPTLLTGRDLLGQAATGTGKTAAFALPALQHIEKGAPKGGPSVLVLVPTRELAVQVSEAMVKYGKELGARVVPVFGGQPIGRQLGALDRGAHVVVATPGRAIDHIGRGSLQLGQIKTVILDEADEMLDMGFTDDIESILESTPDDRQTVLFSATMPPRINSIAKRYQNDPVRIKIGKSEEQESQKLIRQTVYFVKRSDKPYALGRVLDIETPDAALVFCRTRMEVDQLTSTMNVRGYRAEALHGGMDQAQRDRVMGRLRDGTAELLVATDVAARGLDIDTLTHVVNYDVPAAAESYVHRIGRVGRAGREGTAITLADPRERRLLQNIERLTKHTIEVSKVPTVADLRARQVELTVAAVRESLTSPDLEDYNGVLHALAGEDSDRNIALAAIKLVHLSSGAVLDEREIPDASDNRNDRSKNFKDGKDRKRDRDRNGRPGTGKREASHGKGERDRGGNPDTAFVFVSQGRKAGVRPGDLVGAIANESGLVGRDIGPIRISDNYAVVGVPKSELNNVIEAMAGTTMRGKPVKVRAYND